LQCIPDLFYFKFFFLVLRILPGQNEKTGGKKIKSNGKSIWKITLSVFTLLMIMTLLSAGASASIYVTKTVPLQKISAMDIIK